MKDFKQHIQNFKQKLIDREPFAFARYSDGELFILQNKELILGDGFIKVGEVATPGPYKSQDFKHFNPAKDVVARERLLQAFAHKQPGYYKGISCQCCVGPEAFQQQIDIHGGDDESLTWANLFVNSNYPTFIEEVLPVLQTYDTVMICHEDANLEKLEFVTKDFRVGYNAMINDYEKINTIKDWIDQEKVEGRLFLFSASTFSNLAIYELYKHNQKNTYLDIGTCLTPFMGMPTERSYLQEYWYNIPGNDLKRNCTW
jgi:hypothetical protein